MQVELEWGVESGVFSGIQNESFIGRNWMNAAALRQNTEIKLNKYRLQF